MIDPMTTDILVKRVNRLERELAHLKRDLLWATQPGKKTTRARPTLFGSVAAGDITAEMIDEARADLFRTMDDL